MNEKHIKRHLVKIMDNWLNTITNPEVKKIIRNNAIITGGALVSLITGEPVKDYDVYFKTQDAVEAVAKYYVSMWNEMHNDNVLVVTDNDRVKIWKQSDGVVGDMTEEEEETAPYVIEERSKKGKEKFSPVFMSSNAITLSDRIQVIIRFYGDIDEIHKNFDYVHCTCSWDAKKNILTLPSRALMAIINKELVYMGSKYPLCSIFRARKYINRGYTINAGQYVKMAMQLNELDLTDVSVLEEQLMGVDSTYFQHLIDAVRDKKESNPDWDLDANYVIDIVNRIF